MYCMRYFFVFCTLHCLYWEVVPPPVKKLGHFPNGKPKEAEMSYPDYYLVPTISWISVRTTRECFKQRENVCPNLYSNLLTHDLMRHNPSISVKLDQDHHNG